MSFFVIILLIIVLINLSLKLTFECTASEEQLSVSLTGQYLFFHFHKRFYISSKAARSKPLPKKPDVDAKMRLSPNTALRHALKDTTKDVLHHLQIHQLAINIKIHSAAYPVFTTLYGMLCAIIGACQIKGLSSLPLQFTLTPTENNELLFFYGKSIISLSIGHIIYAAMILSSQLFKQYRHHNNHNGRRIAYAGASHQ